MLALTLVCVLAGDGDRFFERREVEFWRSGRREAEPADELWGDSTAPAPVKRLLERPSAEHARAYLAWQEERFRRLRAAIAAVEAAQGRKPPAPLLYFARDGCPWCEREEEELRGLPVTRVPAGSPLWEQYGVTVTPTLVAGGTVLRGFTRRDAILKELRHD